MSPLVIFDTATRLVYCEDVHEMLAAPAGSTVTYDYREKWIDPSSLNALRAGACVVLMYCELPAFDRKVDAQFYWGASPVSIPGARFAATRTGIVDAVRFEGGVYHIVIRLQGYVSIPSSLLEMQIDRLPSRPGRHFVVQATESWEAAWLLRSDRRDAWVSVVDSLQTPDLQFRHDVFWRVEAVIDSRTNQPLRTDENGAYRVRTGRSVRILIASHTGRLAAAELAWDARRVRVSTSAVSPSLVVKSRPDISIRRAGESFVEISFPVTAEWRKTVETLFIRTDAEAVLGSSVKLVFSVTHHPVRLISALLCAAAAAVGTALSGWLLKEGRVGEGVLLAGLAFVAGFFGSRILPWR